MGYSPNKQKELSRTSMFLKKETLDKATVVSQKIVASRTQVVDALVWHGLNTLSLREIADMVRPKIEEDADDQPSLFS